jgi:hypothetical protein
LRATRDRACRRAQRSARAGTDRGTLSRTWRGGFHDISAISFFVNTAFLMGLKGRKTKSRLLIVLRFEPSADVI